MSGWQKLTGHSLAIWEIGQIADKVGSSYLTLLKEVPASCSRKRLKEGNMAKPLAKAVRRLLLPYRGH